MTYREACSAMRARIATRSAFRLVAAMAALVMLHSCASSPPTHYVTLNDVPGAVGAVPVHPVQLTTVHIPAELDRPEVVTQPAPNQLEISETERWAAPLGQLMRLTLARDLQTRLPEGVFVLPDSPAGADTRALVVNLTHIELPSNGALTIDATWTLVTRRPDHIVFTQHATLRAAVMSNDVDAKAAAMSQVLGELADQIADSMGAR